MKTIVYQRLQNINEVVPIGESKFPLNKSKSRYISFGLPRDYNYAPFLKVMGTEKDIVIFDENLWKGFLKDQRVITDFL